MGCSIWIPTDAVSDTTGPKQHYKSLVHEKIFRRKFSIA